MFKWLTMRGWSIQKREAAAAYFFLSPWIIGFLFLTLGPMLASLYFSFTDYDIISPPQWIGFENYGRLMQDDLFWHSWRVTLYFAALALPLSLVIGLLLAVLLNQKIPFVRVWRTLYFLPSVLTGVAVTLLWVILLNPRQGVINQLLKLIGINGPSWLHDPDWAVPSLVIISLWGVGQTMIIYLAGLQGVPTDLYDAAKVDGASVTQRFRFITLPMMSPVIFYNLVLGLIATLNYFTQAYIAGSAVDESMGAPARSTLFYNLYLYHSAFNFFEMGYASAMAWILFVIVLLLTLLVFRSANTWVHYEGDLRR